jgi:hypothetical protein
MHFENIVIGSSLSSVLFSYYNKYPIVINSLERPFRFDEMEKEICIGDLKTKNNLCLWSWALFEVSSRGHAPFGSCVSSVRISGNRLSIAARPGLSFKAEFDNCHIFDDNNLTTENDIFENKEPLYRVFDWMNVRRGMRHRHDSLKTVDNFIKEIYFYKSERIDGNHDRKDAVAVSYLTEEQLHEFNYSSTMARFKIQSVMKDAGIIGAKAGKTKEGKQKKYNVRVEPDYRHVVNMHKRTYRDTENVKFLDMSPKEVVDRYVGRG